MDSKSTNAFAIMKSDTVWVAITIICLFMAVCCYKFGEMNGVMKEKISALEDVVFIHGLYKEIDK